MKTWFRAGRRPAVQEERSAAAGVGAPEAAALADIVLVTRQGCHLCEQAEPVVQQVAAAHDASILVTDVDQDEELRERYTAHVPVVFVRGRLLSYWHVDAELLEQAVAGRAFDEPPLP